MEWQLQTQPYLNPNITWSGLVPKPNGFFRGPCTTNFVKTGRVASGNSSQAATAAP